MHHDQRRKIESTPEKAESMTDCAAVDGETLNHLSSRWIFDFYADRRNGRISQRVSRWAETHMTVDMFDRWFLDHQKSGRSGEGDSEKKLNSNETFAFSSTEWREGVSFSKISSKSTVSIHQNLSWFKIDDWFFCGYNRCIIFCAFSPIYPIGIDEVKDLSMIFIRLRCVILGFLH
jgi:hypothetical protein